MGDEENRYKIFLGNLSWNIDERTLRDHGEKFGEVVHSKVVFDRQTGRSKGFGFLAYADEKSFERALRGLDGLEIDGREVRASRHQEKEGGSHNVDRDRDADYRRPPPPPGGYSRGRDYDYDRQHDRGGGRDRGDSRRTASSYDGGRAYDNGAPTGRTPRPGHKIYIGNLSFDTTSDDLKRVYSKFGNIEYCSVSVDKNTGRSRGFGFVTYFNADDMHAAIRATDGREVLGRMVKVMEANKGEQASSGAAGYSRDYDDRDYQPRGRDPGPPPRYDAYDRAAPYESRPPAYEAYPSSRGAGYDDRRSALTYEERGPAASYDDRIRGDSYDSRGASRAAPSYYPEETTRRGYADDRGYTSSSARPVTAAYSERVPPVVVAAPRGYEDDRSRAYRSSSGYERSEVAEYSRGYNPPPSGGVDYSGYAGGNYDTAASRGGGGYAADRGYSDRRAERRERPY